MAKKSHESIEMWSEEDGVKVIEAEGRVRAEVAGQVLEEIEGEGHEFDELETDDSDSESDFEAESESDSDSDAFKELDAEFGEADEYDGDDEDDDEVVVARTVEADESVSGGDSTDLDDDAHIEDDASGWLPDPDDAELERFWDGTEWTDQVRPVEEPGVRGRQHLPDHVPELQRALAAATADIDDVEARLSTLFDRGKRAGAPPTAAAPAAVAGPPIHEEFGGGGTGGRDASSDDGAHPKYMGEEGAGQAFGDDDDEDATFAELDAALAAETPDKRDRRFFKRRT